ncbi:MAG: hypothetical protein GF416_00375 [Candidatus Altiarchaeales archaeon]|nr:hypothetical protein [Candidatus Altiarchaeales archaeon]MBD3415575.1 hypothetical protein [Candidatus Altiarchaeales archaeon]
MRLITSSGKTLYVWKNIQLVKSRIALFMLLLMLALALFILNKVPYSSLGLFLVPISYGLGVYSYKSYLAWRVGFLGEEAVKEVLRSLSDSYILLSGLVVPPNRGDIDYLVIGPNGIFVVEAKNYGGRISCDGDEWKKIKVGRGGSTYNLEIGSPSNQVKRSSKVLKDYILAHQSDVFNGPAPHIWVHGLLVFTNPDAEIELKNPSVEVVDLDSLCDHILRTKSEYSLSPEEVERMGSLLSRI